LETEILWNVFKTKWCPTKWYTLPFH
jgi:hypothetical protein